MIKRTNANSGIDSNFGLSDEDIYTLVMLHRYQKLSIYKIGQRFGISAAKVRKLISRRSRSDCCG